MITILRRLEALEKRMDTRDNVPRFNITIDYVEAADGAPTGRVRRVRYSVSEVISEEELLLDPQTLRNGKSSGRNGQQ